MRTFNKFFSAIFMLVLVIFALPRFSHSQNMDGTFYEKISIVQNVDPALAKGGIGGFFDGIIRSIEDVVQGVSKFFGITPQKEEPKIAQTEVKMEEPNVISSEEVKGEMEIKGEITNEEPQLSAPQQVVLKAPVVAEKQAVETTEPKGAEKPALNYSGPQVAEPAIKVTTPAAKPDVYRFSAVETNSVSDEDLKIAEQPAVSLSNDETKGYQTPIAADIEQAREIAQPKEEQKITVAETTEQPASADREQTAQQTTIQPIIISQATVQTGQTATAIDREAVGAAVTTQTQTQFQTQPQAQVQTQTITTQEEGATTRIGEAATTQGTLQTSPQDTQACAAARQSLPADIINVHRLDDGTILVMTKDEKIYAVSLCEGFIECPLSGTRPSTREQVVGEPTTGAVENRAIEPETTILQNSVTSNTVSTTVGTTESSTIMATTEQAVTEGAATTRLTAAQEGGGVTHVVTAETSDRLISACEESYKLTTTITIATAQVTTGGLVYSTRNSLNFVAKGEEGDKPVLDVILSYGDGLGKLYSTVLCQAGEEVSDCTSQFDISYTAISDGQDVTGLVSKIDNRKAEVRPSLTGTIAHDVAINVTVNAVRSAKNDHLVKDVKVEFKKAAEYGKEQVYFENVELPGGGGAAVEPTTVPIAGGEGGAEVTGGGCSLILRR